MKAPICCNTKNCQFLRMRRYYTNHKLLNGDENVKEQQSPFVFPSCSQTLSYLQWWKMQKKKAIFKRDRKVYKDRHKILQSRNILQRLQVNVEIEAEKHKKLDKVIAMTDVNPQYFTELAGRPVKEKFLLKEYIQDIREILKTKLLIGQEKDYCIRIDQQFEQETHRLRQIQHRCQRYVSNFDEFLSKDHEKSMQMLKKAEWEIKLTDEIGTRKSELVKQFGQIRLEIYILEEHWRLVKMCQMFLYCVSPVAWRTKYEAERGITLVDTPSIDLFNRYKTLDETAPLEKLLELFEQDITDAGPTVLYFEDPFDLIRIFRTMETQNLNALVYLESLAAPMADMTITITVTEAQIEQEINEITSTINDLENFIIEAENRAANLEEYANYLLRDVFRYLVCSEEVLYLRVFIEDAYESCIGPNDANLDSFSMLIWIEKLHEELNLQLDNLPREIVRACKREGFRQEMKIIKDAEDAAKKFELMHRLLEALKRVMELPVSKKRPLIRRSVPIITKMKPPLRLSRPTDEELQYLTFFTDYCRVHDDFVTYRFKFPDDFDLTFQSKREDIKDKTTFNDTSSSDLTINVEAQDKIFRDNKTQQEATTAYNRIRDDSRFKNNNHA
ncbi:CP100 protein, partial [Pseudoatta argentina]